MVAVLATQGCASKAQDAPARKGAPVVPTSATEAAAPETANRTIDLSGNTHDVAKWIWLNLVPKRGQADTVQGEVLRAIEKLRWEAQQNGNINWDSGFVRLIDFIGRTFVDAGCFSDNTLVSIRRDLDRLNSSLPPDKLEDRSRAAALPYVEDDLYDRLVEHLVVMCRHTPNVIPRAKDPALRR